MEWWRHFIFLARLKRHENLSASTSYAFSFLLTSIPSTVQFPTPQSPLLPGMVRLSEGPTWQGESCFCVWSIFPNSAVGPPLNCTGGLEAPAFRSQWASSEAWMRVSFPCWTCESSLNIWYLLDALCFLKMSLGTLCMLFQMRAIQFHS